MINNKDKIRDRQYQKSIDQLRRKILLAKPRTLDDYFNEYLKLFGVYYERKYIEFTRLLWEWGYNFTTCDVRDTLCDLFLKYYKNDFKSITQLDESFRMLEIDHLSGKNFEDFLIWFFRQQGYTVHKTKTGADRGADFLMIYNAENTAVQAKRHKKKIGNKAVQEVFAAQKYYNCSSAMVITNNYFTKHALELAWKCNVKLIDRNKLNNMISQARF